MIATEPWPGPPAPPEALTDLPEGWFNHGTEVLRLLEVVRPLVVVELGTWLGASAIAIARSIRRWGGTITCVDTWAGVLDAHGGSPEGQPPMMLWSCARAMVAAGVGASVRLIPADTREAARTWRTPIDVLYVDADHSYAGVYADLEAWAPWVRPGGLLLGDDYGHASYPGVAQAWAQYATAHGLTLHQYQSTPPRADGIQLVSAWVPREETR